MAEMQVNKRSVRGFLASGKQFAIPEYQRPYSWGIVECQTLWEDIVNFFASSVQIVDSDDEYFLGSVVGFIEEKNKNTLEIIDGQQRITTLSLLFRALYEKANRQEHKKDETKGYIKAFGQCLWQFDEGSEEFQFDKPYIQSRVILDSDNAILRSILSQNYDYETIKQSKSLYAKNFLFFCKEVDEFISNNIDVWGDFCKIILNKIVILPIECNNQENAMRIFTTLNNRGLPLSDSDIIKGRIYASIQDKDRKKEFANKWKELESNLIDDKGEKYFDMDFLFIQYMHITRARNKDSSNEVGLRRFYATDKYKDVLKDSQKVMQEIEELQDLWLNIHYYDERFGLRVIQMFDVLSCYPSDYWKVLISAYYFYCKDKGLDFFSDKNLLPFLRRYVAALLVQYIDTPSRNNARILIFNAYTSLYKKGTLDFGVDLKEYLKNEIFKNRFFETRKIATALMTLHLYDKYPTQEIIIEGEIEHILPQKWQNTNYNGWNKEDAKKYLEQIGNKMWLEKKLNIQAGNGYFGKKKEKYRESKFLEARELADHSRDDWHKEDIQSRSERIYERLKEFFAKNL